jgi:hypothetical protein
MTYYAGRRLRSRLERVERLVLQAERSAPILDMSDEQLADRLMQVLHMAQCIKALGQEDVQSREIVRDAAKIEVLFSNSAAA